MTGGSLRGTMYPQGVLENRPHVFRKPKAPWPIGQGAFFIPPPHSPRGERKRFSPRCGGTAPLKERRTDRASNDTKHVPFCIINSVQKQTLLYSERIALIGSNLAARIAGISPNNTPHTIDNPKLIITTFH